ncbi:ADP-ribosylation factor-like protein 3 isoform X1 [Stegodyphus dumicola]|uniref:ADP-ribosylation factor-like protein 3 isoform X1 n=1 Tax=Stegodyphus dumicola TaxID=202533 RepID=UPI0015A838D9|nr:ADP-ribosylation factor-like protein 3 isoform X1 [Stegodyphus dumicola]
MKTSLLEEWNLIPQSVMIDDSVKKILVLGLDKAGKSSFLSHLSKAEDNANKPEHTEGFSVVSVNCKNGKTLNFWEINLEVEVCEKYYLSNSCKLGGSVNIRVYWSNFVQDTDVLIYIVDSADDHRLAESIQELHKLVACDRLKKVPIFILANKQIFRS